MNEVGGIWRGGIAGIGKSDPKERKTMNRVWGKKARSRATILHAAKVLFEEKGIKGVTFNDIAKEADMSRTTIFNHFPTINDLMLALMEQEMDDLKDYCDLSRLSGRELIISMFAKIIDDTANYPQLTTTLLANSIINEVERNSVKQVETIIEDNLEGDYTDEQKEELVIRMTGLYYGLVNHYFINGYEFDREKLKREFNELVSTLI
ncbi:MAG: TetR/AcrR family transcriptional regulator [Anaerovoracaceae bacterium]|jgi:AcrR family transcriptional regulator